MPANGFFYIYTNNESTKRISFNNLSIVHYSGVLLEENHYYPYGLLIEGITPDASVSGTINKYKFIDRELQLDFGLNQYDLGARFYDPAIGRFNVIDPFADFAANFTPYRYGFDNPVSISDPTGLLEDDFEREYGDLDLNGGNGPGEGITGVSIPINTETSKQKSEQREEVEMIRLSAFEGLLEENHNNYVIAQRSSTGQEKESNNYSDWNDEDEDLDFDYFEESNTGNVVENTESNDDLDREGGSSHAGFIGLTISQIAFNEIATPIVLAEPFAFGELLLGAINLGFLIYNNPPTFNMSSSKDYSGLTANQIISKYRKGSVRSKFPGEYLNCYWEQIVKEANSGVSNAKTAKKLLLDGRFAK